jgi:hypothetical protein
MLSVGHGTLLFGISFFLNVHSNTAQNIRNLFQAGKTEERPGKSGSFIVRIGAVTPRMLFLP